MFQRNFAALTTFIAAVATAPLIRSQTNALVPKWEAVSIKPCTPGGRGGVAGAVPGRITVNCVSLTSLIRQSWILFANGRTMNLEPTKLVPMDKSPAWVDSDLYTIEAKAESNPGQATPGQAMMLGPMMQAVLEDRFKLKIHRETRQVPVYALTVIKGGPKLQPAAQGNCVAQNLDQPLTPLAPGQRRLLFCGVAFGSNNGFNIPGATMAQLSTALSGRTDRKVVDKTGIDGMFDITLNWSGGELPSGLPPPPAPPQPGVPPPPAPDRAEVTADIQSALQKLGLKLEPAQGPEDVLVVDHVERPSEN